jgi:hypothetical protein
MAEEIPLGEIGTSKGRGSKGYIALGIGIGLAIGISALGVAAIGAKKQVALACGG